MLSCSMWFSAPSFWMGGGLESRCVGRVYGADGAVRLAFHIISQIFVLWCSMCDSLKRNSAGLKDMN